MPELELPEKPQHLRGQVISFDGLPTVVQYEDALVEHFAPTEWRASKSFQPALETWRGRKSLVNELRPNKFFGRIGQIVVAHMETPLEELIDHSSMFKRLEKHHEWFDRQIIGMHIVGRLFSTGQGQVGSLDARVWMYPHLPAESKATGATHPTNRAGDLGLYMRVIDKAKRTEEDVELLIARSRAVSEEVLKYALRYPYGGGFETTRKHSA